HITDQDAIDKPASLRIVREFLAAVASGKRFSSIFIASVLNSVPFAEDRRHIVTLLAALAWGTTARVYGAASSTKAAFWRDVTSTQSANVRAVNSVNFRLSYEPGIKLGDPAGKPKVQKYHSVSEFRGLFQHGFLRVDARSDQDNVVATAWGPKRPDWSTLS